MKSCVVIACDHGFGHVRRCLLVSNALAERGWVVTLFAPESSVKRFEANPQLAVSDFSTRTTIAGLLAGDALGRNWYQQLPPLEKFDVVLSDNLPEVLRARPDAILCGSFLWHLALPGMNSKFAAETLDLVAKSRPRMISSGMFALPGLAEQTNLLEVGLYACGPRPDFSGRDLLIAGGGSAVMDEQFRKLIAHVASGPRPLFPVIWVDPRLMPQQPPTWMRVAEFGPALYSQLAAAICRPGVGTVTDCLWAGARVFAIHEPGNVEMAFNAQRLANAGVGEASSNAQAAYAAACSFAAAQTGRVAHLEAIDRVDFSGVEATVAILEQIESADPCAA